MRVLLFVSLILLLFPGTHAADLDYDELLLKLQNQKQQLSLPLYLDNTALGELGVILQGENIAAVSSKDIIALLPIVKKARQQLTELEIGGELNLDDLSRLNISLVYDPVSLRIIVQVPLKLLHTKIISGAGTVQKKELMRAPNGYSVFLNGRYGFQELETTDRDGVIPIKEHGLDLETGVSINGWLLESAGIGSYETDTSTRKWRRNYTRLVYDSIPNAARLNIGDLSYGVDAFQYLTPLAGIGYSSNRQLAPDKVGRTTGSESFFLEDTSRVEVYVNNRLVRTLYLARGNYELRDLPGVSGVNDVRLTVSNARGERTDFDYSFLFSQNLLAKGEHDYSYNVGVLRERSSSGDRYGSEPLLSLFHRYGVYNGLTLGANLQANKTHYMPGISMHLASSAGALLAQFNSSHHRSYAPANAARLQYRYEKQSLGQVDVSWEYYDDNFFAPNKPEALVNGDRKSQTIFRLTRTLSRRIIGFANYRYNTLRSEFKRSKAWEIGVAARLFRRVRLNFVSSRFYSNQQWEDVGFRVDLSWQAIQSRQIVNSQYESGHELLRTNYSGQHVAGQHEFSNQLSHQSSELNGAMRTGGVFQYANHRLESSASFEKQQSETTSQSFNRFSIGGALVMSDNQWALSRPVTGSFAIVDTNVNLKGNTIGVNPRSGGGFQSTISKWSPAVIAGLSPYYSQSLGVDAKGTDLEFDEATQNLSVTSNYRSGTRIYIEADTKKVIGGRIFFDQKPVRFTAGELTSSEKDSGITHMFFTNEQGEYLIEGVEPGVYRIVLYGRESETGIIEIKPEPNKKIIVPDLHL